VEKKDRIGAITLNRPEKFNTFSTELARELNDGLLQLDSDDDVSVIIVKARARPSPRELTSPNFPARPGRNIRSGSA